MKRVKEKGFSVIELLVVMTVIGIIVALAIPYLRKAVWASENGAVFATARTLYGTQVSHMGQKSRFARLSELNALHSGAIGTMVGPNSVKSGNFIWEMVPSNPTDDELKTEFEIKVTKSLSAGDLPYVIKLTHKGEIEKIAGP